MASTPIRLWPDIKRAARLVAALIVVGSVSVEAQRAVPNGTVQLGKLSFDGRATAGDFVGTTDSVSGRLTGGASLAEVRGFVEAPVRTLVTGNGRRDKDLNKSMESDKYPTIRFELTAVRPEWERGDSVGVALEGNLTIHGVTQQRTLNGTVFFEGQTVRVQTSFPLNLKDYKIGGLSKFLGVLKMHEDIVVHVDVTFALEAAATPPPAPPPPAG